MAGIAPFVAVWIVFTCMNVEAAKRITPPDDNNVEFPETMAGLFEGDIQISKFRNAVSSLELTWEDGIVPYTVEGFYPEFALKKMHAAMERIEKATETASGKCITFVPRTNEHDYLAITQGTGCSSEVGRQIGKQNVSLVFGCFSKGAIMHELIHSLGFWHEQSRSDRDEHIEIQWKNVKPGHRGNFMKRPPQDIHHLGVGYDLMSIMHYGAYYFSKNGEPTIVPKDFGMITEIGQREDLSPLDIKRIQILYGCTEGDRPPPSVIPRIQNTPKPMEDALFHCDFEDGWCGIDADADGSPFWTIDSAKRKDGSETGPDGDHTTGSGHYAAVRNDGVTGVKVAMSFEVSEPSENGYCLQFWYNMYGANSGMLYVGTETSPGLDIIIGDQGPKWKQASYSVGDTEGTTVSIQAIYGTDTWGDVAIDDIVVFEGKC